MTFQVLALDAAPFVPLYGLADEALAVRGVRRVVATESPGYPCRVSLADADAGEPVLLLNWEHLAGATPYRSRHAIFVREGAEVARPAAGEVPEMLARRLLAVRSYDLAGEMLDADVVEGITLAPLIGRLFEDGRAAFLHVHNARRGCYAARVERA